MKFGRTYRLNVQVGDSQPLAVVGGTAVPTRTGPLSSNPEAVNIEFPLTLYLDVSRNTLASANKGYFKIINLKEETRRKIFHDRYNTLTYRQIVLTAGYESEPKLPIIFQGNILSAYSYRQKQDWVTEIEALDGGFGIINGQVSTTLPSGYNIRSVIESAIRTMPNVAMGAVGDVEPNEQNARGVTMMGNSWDVINATVPDAVAFVDNEKANVIGKNEYIASDDEPFLISSDTGLLETPRRFDARLDVKMMFEPRLRMGQLVQLLSQEKYYNGLYSVIGVQHRGVISGAVGGELTTIASVWKGTSQLQAVAS